MPKKLSNVEFNDIRDKLFKDATDEQLRILRLSTATELERRIARLDQRFFRVRRRRDSRQMQG